MRFTLLLLLSFWGWLPLNRAAAMPPDSARTDVLARVQALPPFEMDEVLWLARCIYSESNRPHEQRLVAWVVRNRYETGFGGRTYRDVVLKYKQFSAFNQPSDRRAHLLSLDQHARGAAWREALDIALDVYEAPAGDRPFPVTVRHFYSPISMQPRYRVPNWAQGETPLASADYDVDPQRFLFFDAIDMTFDDGEPRLARTAMEHRTEGRTKTAERPQTRIGLRRLRPSGAVARPARPSASGVQRPTRPK